MVGVFCFILGGVCWLGQCVVFVCGDVYVQCVEFDEVCGIGLVVGVVVFFEGCDVGVEQ